MTNQELLTKEELSSLLENGEHMNIADPATGRKRRIQPYNFRRPDRIPRDHIRSLFLLHDLFAHSLSSSLPVVMRTGSTVSLVSLEQQPYSEYLQSLPDPTAMFTLSMHPLPGLAAIELNPSVAFPVIDRMLGGAGQSLDETRAVTEIEQRILEGFLKVVTDDLQAAWKPLVELDLQILGRETRPQMLQIVAPNEAVLVIIFQMQIAESRGNVSLCIPAITLEPVIQQLSQTVYSSNRGIPPEQTRTLLDTLSHVMFEVAADLKSTKVSMDDLLALATGDVLRLDHRVAEPIDIKIGGVKKFEGNLMAQDRRTVLAVTEIQEGR